MPTLLLHAYIETESEPKKYLINVISGKEIEVTYDDSSNQYWLYKAPDDPPHPSGLYGRCTSKMVTSFIK